MTIPVPISTRPRTIIKRLAAVGLGVVTFLVLSSVVEPNPSAASDDHVPGIVNITPRRADEITTALLRRQHPRRWINLGMLEGSEYLVLIYGSPTGARYTVCNILGEMLEEDLAPGDVYRSFPDLDIPGMQLDPATTGELPALMIAEPLN